MTTFFCVTAITGNALVRAAVKQHFTEVYELGSSIWFIADKTVPESTPTQIRDKLGLTAEGLGAQGVQGLVIKSVGTSGFAPTDLWEWFKIQRQGDSNG